MKNGIFREDDLLIYYKDDRPYHAGVVELDGYIYYVGQGGVVATGEHVVHREMSNDLLQRGTYSFDEDGKLIPGSYLEPPAHARRTKNARPPRQPRFPLFRRLSYNNPYNNPYNNNPYLNPNAVAPPDSRYETFLTVFLVCLADIAVMGIVFLLLYSGVFGKIGGDKDVDFNNSSAVSLFFPDENEQVLLCSGAAKMLHDGVITTKEAISISANPYRPLSLDYNISQNGKLLLGEHADLSDAKEFVMPASDKSIQIDNLIPDTTYYYRVTVAEEVHEGSFKTAPSFRFVSMPGVYNTRDIGGYKTADGKQIKYGMIIRGTEMDGLVATDYFLAHNSVDYVSEEFGFVYDLDLRAPDVYQGDYLPRLSGVRHKFYDSPSYGSMFHQDCLPIVKDIFADIANPANYPMYLHCTQGADRTGSVIFLLQGLLGVSPEEMVTEYRLTGYNDKDFIESNRMDVIMTGLQPYKGDTLQEKIEDYLITAVGLTSAEIDSIRNILLEDQ